MARRHKPTKMALGADPVYQNVLIQMIVNRLMKKGKKSLAYRLCYEAMQRIESTTQQDPVSVIEEAIRNVTPTVEVKAKRRGGSTFQVPVPVKGPRGTTMAICWILTACRNRAGRTMIAKLSNEFVDASKNLGAAIRKKDEMSRMAESNRVNARGRF
jgi:small subunit ribosomal protein S7